jgi:hypothetical protein
MTLKKTDKALKELASRQRTLNVKERALLLLADGVTPAQTLLAQVRTTEDVLARLVSEGFLVVCRARSCGPAVSTTTQTRDRVLAQGNANLPPPVSADRFDGQRSLATARMYLFDMTERLFARRTPELAEAIRNDLREARDVDAMLEVAHRLLHTIEETAGSERANAISERLTKLLPAHALVIN